MPETSAYALWGRPSPAAGKGFGSAIKKLSKKFNTPNFIPHITLASGLQRPQELLCETMADVAETLNAVSIHFSELSYSDPYFKALYLAIEKTPALKEVHQAIASAFSSMNDTIFNPHLSLLYGNITGEQKEAVMPSLSELVEYSFSLARLSLVTVSGPVESWKMVQTTPLKTHLTS